MDKPLRCLPLEGQRDQKSPLRRCFKPRPPLSAEYAGFASGCRSRVLRKLGRFLRRLSGLLSGCPPTDTRPQARAKLGNQRNKQFELSVKRFAVREITIGQNFSFKWSRSRCRAPCPARPPHVRRRSDRAAA